VYECFDVCRELAIYRKNSDWYPNETYDASDYYCKLKMKEHT